MASGFKKEILGMTQWESKGCAICRRQWAEGSPPPEIAVSQERRATLHQCKACGTFWEQFERYADVASPDDARRHYPAPNRTG